MTIRKIDVHIGVPGRWRWHRLRLDLPEEATREDVLKAVADEFARPRGGLLRAPGEAAAVNWSRHDARALERRLVSYGVPRDLARRTALLDGPATLARIGNIQRMDLNEVAGTSLLDARRGWGTAAAIPPEIAAWLDNDRVEAPDRPVREKTVKPDVAELAAARAAAEPVFRSKAEALLAVAMRDIPPWPDFDRAAAMPLYLDYLDDLPRGAGERAG